jgi:EmrB/QacA subfamily drug resistance transporter
LAGVTSTPVLARPDLRWTPRIWGALIVLCCALFLDALDVSMVGVALPSIRADLDMSTSALQWVVSAYILGYGGLLLLGGRAADLLGRRQVFLTALVVFAVASLLGGLVSDPALLIAARFVKGVSAAFTAPAGLSIITTTFPEGPARNRALSIYTTCAAAGFSLGLVLSGLLTEFNWRFTFLLPVPIAIIALIAGLRLIPATAKPDRARRGGYDLAGAVTATSAMLLLVYTVTEAHELGWASPFTWGGLLVVAALLAGFVSIERRSRTPLVRLGILRDRALAMANLGAIAFYGSYAGFQFVVTLYLQTLLHWSALAMALAFLPTGALVAISSTSMGSLIDRFGARRLVVIGFVLLVAGYAWFLRTDAAPHYVSDILPSMILLGLSCALCFPSLNVLATTGVSDDEQGLASGLVNTSFQVGGGVGLAVVTAVVTGGGNSTNGLWAGVHPALTVVTLVAALGLATALLGTVRRPVAVGSAA